MLSYFYSLNFQFLGTLDRARSIDLGEGDKIRVRMFLAVGVM